MQNAFGSFSRVLSVTGRVFSLGKVVVIEIQVV